MTHALLALWLALADERAVHDAELRATVAERIDALEQVGARRPIDAWTDDAWSEAARLAATTGDLARERRDLEQVVAIGIDPLLVRRAQGEIARLAAITGAGGEWTQVAAEHERLVSAMATGDPKPALGQLEALARAHPNYPRITEVRLAIARGWQRDGDTTRAVAWLREAVAHDGSTTPRVELSRALVADGAFAEAEVQIASVRDPAIARALRDDLATAEHRRWWRRAAAIMLAAIGAALLALLRRDAGSWRASARALARPPVEVLYFAPVAAVLVAVSWTGNPLVAHAIRSITGTGLLGSWLAGAGPRSTRAGGLVRALLAAAAVGAAAYLAITSGQLVDMVAETVRSGPAPR